MQQAARPPREAAPSFEDVLLQAFLPISQRSPALAAHFRRLVCDVQSNTVTRRHGALDRLLFLVLDELRRLERTLTEESSKRLVALTPRRLLKSLSTAFLNSSRPAEVTGGPSAELESKPSRAVEHASDSPRPAGQLALHVGGVARSKAISPRPSAAHRVACPVRRSREDVVSQYGEPSEWQLAGRGSSKVSARAGRARR